TFDQNDFHDAILLILVGSERQQGDFAGAFNGAGEFTLLLGADGRDAARQDFAALGDEARKQLHITVVDFRRVRAGERAALAAAEEYAARATGMLGAFAACGTGFTLGVTGFRHDIILTL